MKLPVPHQEGEPVEFGRFGDANHEMASCTVKLGNGWDCRLRSTVYWEALELGRYEKITFEGPGTCYDVNARQIDIKNY